MIIFIGDGVSDLPAARECDVLFARRGLRLEEYCIEHNISHIPFDTFKDIEREFASIIKDNRKAKKETNISKFCDLKFVPSIHSILTSSGQIFGEEFQAKSRYHLSDLS